MPSCKSGAAAQRVHSIPSDDKAPATGSGAYGDMIPPSPRETSGIVARSRPCRTILSRGPVKLGKQRFNLG